VLGAGDTPVILATQEAEIRKIEASPGQIIQETLCRKSQHIKGWRVAQVVEHPPQYHKKRKKEREGRKESCVQR
jgi:hypothetical protein